MSKSLIMRIHEQTFDSVAESTVCHFVRQNHDFAYYRPKMRSYIMNMRNVNE